MRWRRWRILKTGDLGTVFRRPELYVEQEGNEVEVSEHLGGQ